jgi:hypothetical protein
MEDSHISITTPDISPISVNIESPIITSDDTLALQHDEPNPSTLSQDHSQHHTPSNTSMDEDFTEITQAALNTTNQKGKSNQIVSSNNSDDTSQTPDQLSFSDAQDFTLFPDNQQQASTTPSTNTHQQVNDSTGPNLFSDERSFLQEHQTSSSVKKARITTASLHERLDRLAASSNSDDNQSPSDHRRSDRLSRLTPINYDESKLC